MAPPSSAKCSPTPFAGTTRTNSPARVFSRNVLREINKVALLTALVLAAPTQSSLAQSRSGISGADRRERPVSARRLWIRAEQGDARAQALLGFMYANGQGVPRNHAMAARWCELAAEQGNATAQHLLGLMYDKGQGVPQDDVLAHMWLNLAAARARPRERDYYAWLRDAVATKMSPAQLTEAQWLAFQWRPQH